MRIVQFSTLLVIAILTGCSTTAPKTDRFQRELFADAEFREVFGAATAALDQAGIVQTRDPIAGLIRTRPTPIRDHNRRSDPSRALNPEYRFQLRRIGEIQVQSDGNEVYVLCKVVIEKNESEGLHSINRNRGVDDQPTQTAAQRDAAYTTEQNEVWTIVRRDRAMERRILNQIRQIIAPPQDTSP